MEEKIYCESCDKKVDFEIAKKEENRSVMGREITIESEIALCTECSDELFHEKLERKNQKKAFDIYREEKGILFPEEIKEIRKKYGLTQRQMSKLLGWGEITYHRYEKGSLPDDAHNNMLKMIRRPENVKEILRSGNPDLSKETINSLKKRVNELKEIKMKLPTGLYRDIKSHAERSQIDFNEYLIYLITRSHFGEKKTPAGKEE